MNDESGYFAMIDALVASLPPDPERLGQALGLTLHHDADASGPAADFWKGQSPGDSGPLERVVLRLPGPIAGSRRALLSLELGSSRGVTRDTIVEKQGDDFSFQPPSPSYPQDSVPAYMVYELPWGRLSYGIFVASPGALREIVMELNIEAERSAEADPGLAGEGEASN